MKKIKRALTKKLGPFPRWVWALIAVGGVVVYRRYQVNKTTGGGNQAYTSPLSPPDLAYEPGGALPIGPAGGGGDSGSGDTSGLLDLLSQLLGQGGGDGSGGDGSGGDGGGSGGGSGSGGGGSKGKPKPKGSGVKPITGKGKKAWTPRSPAVKKDKPRGKAKSKGVKTIKGANGWTKPRSAPVDKQVGASFSSRMAVPMVGAPTVQPHPVTTSTKPVDVPVSAPKATAAKPTGKKTIRPVTKKKGWK